MHCRHVWSRLWIPLLCLATIASLNIAHAQDFIDDNCAGSGAKVRQLILYDLKNTDPDTIKAVNQLFRERLSECSQVLYPGSSYGGAALTTTPTAYGFPPSRPMPVTASIADWVGWMDFKSINGMRECLAINNRTGTLQAMRAYAQPNGRFDLITHKRTVPGNKHEPCPFPGSYAPATVRYIFAYLLPPGTKKTASCKKGTSLWRQILQTAGLDVRHGLSCSVLSDEEARQYDILFNSGFGGYVDFETLRDMTRVLASNNPQIRTNTQQARKLAAYAIRAAIALPWSGRH